MASNDLSAGIRPDTFQRDATICFMVNDRFDNNRKYRVLEIHKKHNNECIGTFLLLF